MGHLGQLPTIHPSHSLKYSSAIVAGALMDTVKESDEASKTHHPLPIEWRCDFIDPERMLQKRGWYLPEDLRVGGGAIVRDGARKPWRLV